MLKYDQLFYHQNYAREFANATPYCSLMMGLGLGKTATALTAAVDQLILGEVDKVLVVGPKRVANTVWHTEAAEWEHLSALRFSNACRPNPKERHAALRKDADIYTINYDNLKWMIQNYNAKWKWQMIILDESSAFKSALSQRFIFTSRLCRDVPAKGWKNPVRRMIQLTATPATNGLLGLWSQVFLLDKGAALGKDFDMFKRRWFELENPHAPHSKMVPISGAKTQIFDRLKPTCLVMRSEDYAVDLKEPIINTIEVDMPSNCVADYAKLEREFVLDYENGDEIIAPNSGALANKLMQFANGAVYTGETPEKIVKDRPYRVVHDEKIEALKELDENAEGSQTMLIAYWFKSDLERIKKALPHAVEMDKEGDLVEPWNKGEISRLVIHPMSAGHGLNLQHGGSTMVFFSLLWSLELYLQTIGRLVRTGQTNAVSINHIITRGSMDGRILDALHSNAETQDEMMEYLKHTLTEVHP